MALDVSVPARRAQRNNVMLHTRASSGVVVLVLLMLLGFGLTLGAAPASQPATSPAQQSIDSVRTWYFQLADRDPEVRERARISLMGVKRKDLAALEKVVAENRPVQASQAAVLYDIVTHVYMAGEPYRAAETAGGFLGMRWDPSERDFWDDPPGVIVSQRLPGFVAYRMLRTGDVIVGIAEMPDLQFATRTDFTSVMQRVPPGTTLTFVVLRGGKRQHVPIQLDARPVVALQGQPPDLMSAFEAERQNKAEEYWGRAFAPLVGDQSVSAAHP